jgi:chromosome segregation ATPase
MLTKTEADAARIYELETQNNQLRADVKRLQAENSRLIEAFERKTLECVELRGNYYRVRAAFEKQTIECAELRAQLAATEEALAQVQRESALLRDETSRDYGAMQEWIKRRIDLPAGRRVVHEVIAYAERLEAAKKVADAAVALSMTDADGGIRGLQEANWRLADAVAEYRALTEPQQHNSKGSEQ